MTMFCVVIAEWDLTPERASIKDLRSWMRETAIGEYSKVPGILLKSWYSGPFEQSWGAVYVLSDPNALNADRLPKNREGATGPIGTPPDRIKWLRLEALIQGVEGFREVLPAMECATVIDATVSGDAANARNYGE